MNIEKEIIKQNLKASLEKYKLIKNKQVDLEALLENYAEKYAQRRFEHINKSLAALELVIQVNKKIPPDYIWNRVAEENGYLNNISIEYVEDKNWRDIGRKILRKQNYEKEDKM